MFRSYKIFRLFGIDVKANTTILLLCAFFYNGMVGIEYDIIKFLLLIGVVLAHEFGHALTAKWYGIGTNNITLNGLGGVALLEDGLPSLPIWKQFMITLNGPLVNVALGVGGILLFHTLGVEATIEMVKEDSYQGILLYFIVFNTVMFIFNMLPVHPMDGGRLLRLTLQACKIKSYVLVSNYITLITAIVALIFFTSASMYMGSAIMVLAIVITLWSMKTKNVIT